MNQSLRNFLSLQKKAKKNKEQKLFSKIEKFRKGKSKKQK